VVVGAPVATRTAHERTNQLRDFFRDFLSLVRDFCRISFGFRAPPLAAATYRKPLFEGVLLVGAPRFELGTPSPPAKNKYISEVIRRSHDRQKPLPIRAF
jgi:hypothetical protein